MPIRDRIIWSSHNPLSDPRLANLDQVIRGIRSGRLAPNVKGGGVFLNVFGDLPLKPTDYYKEYDVEPTSRGKDRGTLRIVLGDGGEVYVTGNHYRDFRQILQMPT